MREMEKKTGKSRALGLVAVALGHTSQPVDGNSQEDVDNDEHPHDAEVAPGVLVVTRDAGKENVGRGDATEGALGGRILGSILECSSKGANIRSHVVLAGLTGWR